MTVPAGLAREQYAGSGSTGPFAFNHKVFVSSHLDVTRTIAGVDTLLVLVTDYTVSLASDFSSASITLVSALAVGQSLTVVLDPPIEQQIAYSDNDPFPAATHERALDLQTMVSQSLAEKISRAPLLRAGSPVLNLVFPDPDANKIIGWNSGGTALENKTIASAGGSIVLPGSSTDNALVRWDGATGDSLQNSTVILDDSGNFTGINSLGVVNAALTGYVDLVEIATPANPAVNTARFYAKDDGAGVTTLAMQDSGGNVAPMSHFLQSGTGAVTRTQQAKLRDIVNAADFGFSTVASAAANATAFNAAIAALVALGGGILELPPGSFQLDDVSSITGNNIQILGKGAFNGGTTLVPTSATTNTIVFSGCQHSGIKDVYFRPTVRKTAGYAVAFTANAYCCYADNVRVDHHYNGFLISSATETRISRVQTRFILGFAGINFAGSVGAPSFRAIIDDYLGNNPYPGTAYGTVKTHTNSTAYSLNDIIVSGSYIWQCTTAGTSGVGTPPTVPGGTTAQDAFNVGVTDGTVTWKMVCFSDSCHIIQENYAYSLVINKAACINLGRGFRQLDSAATGTSYPIWAFIWGLESDHPFAECVQLDRGEGCFINGSWLGSSLSSRGVLINTNYRGEVQIGGGTRIAYNRLDGVLLQAGPVDTIIDGCFIGDNSQSGSGSNHGIAVGANATRFQITNNRIGDIVGVAGNNQGWGVLVNTGSSDNYVIQGNQCSGNVTGGVIDAGTGTHKVVRDNNDGVAAGKIGYASGSGGAATQATSKATTVTLNKVCGQLTLNGAILNANTGVTFTFTNSAIEATDQIAWNHRSGGTIGAYAINATCGAGSATVTLRNITAGNLTEAPVYDFVVVKSSIT